MCAAKKNERKCLQRDDDNSFPYNVTFTYGFKQSRRDNFSETALNRDFLHFFFFLVTQMLCQCDGRSIYTEQLKNNVIELTHKHQQRGLKE